MNKPELATTAFAALHGLVKNLPSDFDLSWDFEGSRHFIGKEASLVGYRAWLLDLFSAVEEKDAQKRLRALNKTPNSFVQRAQPLVVYFDPFITSSLGMCILNHALAAQVKTVIFCAFVIELIKCTSHYKHTCYMRRAIKK
jgi:hypothetical protein